MSEKFVAAIDQGTTSTRCMVFNHEGRVVSVDQREHEQIFPQGGLGRAQRDRDLGEHQGSRGGRARQGRPDREGHRRGRHHQPARDRRWSGTGPPASRSTTPSSGRTPAPTDRRRARRSRRRRGPVQGQGRPAAGHLLLRPQGQVDPRQRRGRPGEGRGRRPGVRQHGHLGAVEHDRRRRRRPARHRRRPTPPAPC